jgi:hypothetical protein
MFTWEWEVVFGVKFYFLGYETKEFSTTLTAYSIAQYICEEFWVLLLYVCTSLTREFVSGNYLVYLWCRWFVSRSLVAQILQSRLLVCLYIC